MIMLSIPVNKGEIFLVSVLQPVNLSAANKLTVVNSNHY